MFGNTRVCVRVVATADGVHSPSLIGPLPVYCYRGTACELQHWYIKGVVSTNKY